MRRSERLLRLLVTFVPVVLGLALAGSTRWFLLGPLGVISSVGVATLMLRREGVTWRDLGLRRPTSLRNTILASGALAIGLEILTSLLGPLAIRLGGHPPDLRAFAVVRGNLAALLGGLFLSWTTAAFGEEMLFRGYLLTQLRTLLGDGGSGWRTWAAPVLIGATLFGLGHAYQGLSGAILTGAIGLALGAAYAASRRNLWMVIVAHGGFDTFGFLALYLSLDRLMKG